MNTIKNMNLPNKLTCLRMILIVPFVLCMLLGKAEGVWKIASLVIFILASLTDTLDGIIARRNNLITDFGKFMDPLADKLLVCSAMIYLIELGRLPSWIVIIIIAREFIISGFRLVASDNGIVIAASMWGKFKTTFQMIMIVMLIINFEAGPLHIAQTAVMYIALALTLISLIDYIIKNKNVLSMQS